MRIDDDGRLHKKLKPSDHTAVKLASMAHHTSRKAELIRARTSSAALGVVTTGGATAQLESAEQRELQRTFLDVQHPYLGVLLHGLCSVIRRMKNGGTMRAFDVTLVVASIFFVESLDGVLCINTQNDLPGLGAIASDSVMRYIMKALEVGGIDLIVREIHNYVLVVLPQVCARYGSAAFTLKKERAGSTIVTCGVNPCARLRGDDGR